MNAPTPGAGRDKPPQEGAWVDIVEATAEYEAWLSGEVAVIGEDLEVKHRVMAESVFGFLRATFYRWSQRWPRVCEDVATAPRVVAVGDLHVENFGTWRDVEGRLVWGVNDFDETATAPYTNDLVRLAVSAELARTEAGLARGLAEVCDAVEAGYRSGLDARGGPFALTDRHRRLRRMTASRLSDPDRFWEKMAGLPPTDSDPSGGREALEAALPEPGLAYTLHRRVAGVGSLGHPRLVARAAWRGGTVLREAKQLAPSAWEWANADSGSGPTPPSQAACYQQLVSHAVRSPDPMLRLSGRWVVRRLAPDCVRLELAELPSVRDEAHLLAAMGWETANVHLAKPDEIAAVQRDLRHRPAGWLRAATQDAVSAVTRDWHDWRQRGRP